MDPMAILGGVVNLASGSTIPTGFTEASAGVKHIFVTGITDTPFKSLHAERGVGFDSEMKPCPGCLKRMPKELVVRLLHEACSWCLFLPVCCQLRLCPERLFNGVAQQV